jgi:hypothetical protein
MMMYYYCMTIIIVIDVEHMPEYDDNIRPARLLNKRERSEDDGNYPAPPIGEKKMRIDQPSDQSPPREVQTSIESNFQQQLDSLRMELKSSQQAQQEATNIQLQKLSEYLQNLPALIGAMTGDKSTSSTTNNNPNVSSLPVQASSEAIFPPTSSTIAVGASYGPPPLQCPAVLADSSKRVDPNYLVYQAQNAFNYQNYLNTLGLVKFL